MASLFSSPNPNPKWLETHRLKAKRKRNQLKNLNNDEEPEHLSDIATAKISQPTASQHIEYSAVLTPAERSQRQLAGQPLNEAPPSNPFPHASSKGTRSDDSYTSIWRATRYEKTTTEGSTVGSKPASSLHIQHLSTMTAILHRSLLTRDFQRAFWAFGMILRQEVNGTPIDIRSRGNWGIGAEILFRSDDDEQSGRDNPQSTSPFNLSKFQQVKTYYENLIVLFPYAKTWADSINSLDFYLAMFGLWIYTVNAEYASAQDIPDMTSADVLSPAVSPPDSNADSADVKRLSQATEIANRMDTCMATIPYSDDKDFIRLRAMTALWIADLNDSCARRSRMDSDLSPENDFRDTNSDDEETAVHNYTRKAAVERERAQELFVKLDGAGTTSEDVDTE